MEEERKDDENTLTNSYNMVVIINTYETHLISQFIGH